MVTWSASTAKAANEARLSLFDNGSNVPRIDFFNGSTLLISFELESPVAFSESTLVCPSVSQPLGLPLTAISESFGSTDLVINNAKGFDGDGNELLTISGDSIGLPGSGKPVTITSLTISEDTEYELFTFTVSQRC